MGLGADFIRAPEEGRLLIVYQLLVEPSRAAGFFRYPCWTGSGPEASGDDCDEECCDGSAAVTTPAHALPCLRATKANCSRRNSSAYTLL